METKDIMELLTKLQGKVFELEAGIKRAMDYAQTANRDVIALKRALKKEGIKLEIDLEKEAGRDG